MIPEITTFNDYIKQWDEASRDPAGYFEKIARSFTWKKNWEKTLEFDLKEGHIAWFKGGFLNITENCLDRHLAERGGQPALIWEPNDPREKNCVLTYRQLWSQVCRMASGLKKLGVKKGDRVCIYLPMIPEAAVAMLACARLGAVHSVVFAGFSPTALADRIRDADCSVLITADGFSRGDKSVPLKRLADEALQVCPSVRHVVVVSRSQPYAIQSAREVGWTDLLERGEETFPAEPMEAEDPFFILYTSGSTGKPKGVLHTCGGYMVWAGFTLRNVFQTRPGEIFFCTADVGWVTGHTYGLYGPLLNGLTTVFFEGVPTWPHPGRLWEIVEKYGAQVLYTAPTAIRALEMLGSEIPDRYAMPSLRVLGSVGEPINTDAWLWYHRHVGKERCPIVDTWWQTETGGILISTLAGVTPSVPAWATLPLPGVQPVLLDEEGREVPNEAAHTQGYLCLKSPWPGMMRSVFGSHQRFVDTYLRRFPGYYFTGDGALRNAQGHYRIIGRVDDVVNVSGHRIGTGEVEDALNMHDLVTESAVVGMPHPVKGEALHAFVLCPPSQDVSQGLKKELQDLVAQKIGRFAVPEKIFIVPGLPKTRSGKIMRRILRKILAGERDLGDTTSLLDPAVVETIRQTVWANQ
ncbi:MAG: acetate--CoA ligase [Flavobacteriales bacterium]|nr:acetate--CoA ligase [Flavobacteriales bacterium]MCX7649012.1 acetate--CoA ligase [Flavobacteriales bacterium]MDW8431078.1 acetate--CoA ligase [Flavobacteriales bacterium]